MPCLSRLVSLRALFWWVFIYQKWPLKPAMEQAWTLWYAVKDIVVALWKLCVTTPIAPIVGAAIMVLDKDARRKIVEGHARKAIPREKVKCNATISFG